MSLHLLSDVSNAQERATRKKPLTVLSVAFPLAAVCIDAVGGAEQVMAVLERALVQRGHKSLVAAQHGAAIQGKLFGVQVPEGTITVDVSRQVERGLQRAIDAAIAFSRPDLIHLHGIDFACYAFPRDIPVLATLHLPPSWYPKSIWQLAENYTLQCVSQAQRDACPVSVQNRIVVVENGVCIPDSAAVPRENFALLLSRICPEKNLHTAIDAARSVGLPLVLAGKVYPYHDHLQYFENEIKPRLGPAVTFVGPVQGGEKARLLTTARCLLVPSLAAETSSLVAMEALAVGTPVVAMRSGALPSIVDDGSTGYLVEDGAGMARALVKLDQIDPETCRRVACNRFNADHMVDRYLRLYRRLTQ